jgi:hypothetical protein
VNGPSTKPYSLDFEERDGYLYARVEADTMTRESAVMYLREIAGKCTELGRDRLLVERHVAGLLSITDLFFIGQELAEMMRGRKVAFVNSNSTHEQALNFGLMVGTNRGAQFQMFPTLAAAEKWLLAA